MTDIIDTFVHPCLVCGTTEQTIDGQLLPHEHRQFDADDSPAAYAWWQGYEAKSLVAVFERQVREHIAATIRAIDIRNFKAGDPNSTFPSAYEVRNRAETIALTDRDPVTS